MSESFPAVTAAQMARVDRVMLDELGVDVLQLMELAGRAVATVARERFLGGDPRGRPVLVLAGGGGNGGDGLVAARLLHAWGAEVIVLLDRDPASLGGPAAHNHTILERLGLPPAPWDQSGIPTLPGADLVIDALLGFGLHGPPSGRTAALIVAANTHPAPVLAVDLPSGLDATTGALYAPCVRAQATLNLALPKSGLLTSTARPVVGDLYVADIGMPATVYARLGLTIPPLFARQEIVRLW
jgi:NAD(P)H-hydrate epimerase